MIFKDEIDVLVYTIRRTEPWWSYLLKQMNFRNFWTISDLRGAGDICIVDDFNKHMKEFYRAPVIPSPLVTACELEDIIARCRLLRFLPTRRARAMVLAMAHIFTTIIDEKNPTFVISFPIDRYVSDVLRLMAKKRSIPYFEMTTGPLPKTVMFLNRGVLQRINKPIEFDTIDFYVDKICQPSFKPSYIKKSVNRSSKLKFLKVFFYFKVRGLVFRAISIFKRDLFNLHYLDTSFWVINHDFQILRHWKCLKVIGKTG